MPPRDSKCPACGSVKRGSLSCEADGEFGWDGEAACFDCGLPVALWNRFRAAMECAQAIADRDVDLYGMAWGRKARKALGRARRKA